MVTLDIAGYLGRLGFEGCRASAVAAEPSVSALRALHRAHVERVAYETLDFQLGRVIGIDPEASAARVVSGRGGYCYILNGALSALLGALGYDVRWRVGGVQGHDQPHPVGANANHLALTVHGLPSREAPAGEWLVDAGLGDALYEPIPLCPGRYVQGPFSYLLRRSSVEPGGWRLDHDPRGSFTGMDFAMAPATATDFLPSHTRLSTFPDSVFVRLATVQRRHRHGIDLLRGCVFRGVTSMGLVERTLPSAELWFTTLKDVFGLALDDLGPEDRDRLWDGVWQNHRRWTAERTG